MKKERTFSEMLSCYAQKLIEQWVKDEKERLKKEELKRTEENHE